MLAYRGSGERHREYSLTRRAAVAQILTWAKNRPCMDCGLRYPKYVMDFDHRPGSEKLFAIAQRTDGALAGYIAEIAKCDVVCANCHRERTFQRRHAA